MDSLDYLALVKRHHNIESDYALSKLMGVPRQTVSNWSTGTRLLNPQNCYRVAELLDLRADLVLADIERERAEKAGKAEDVAYWSEWVKRLGSMAAAVLLGAAITGPTPAEASNGTGLRPVDITLYTS